MMFHGLNFLSFPCAWRCLVQQFYGSKSGIVFQHTGDPVHEALLNAGTAEPIMWFQHFNIIFAESMSQDHDGRSVGNAFLPCSILTCTMVLYVREVF